MMINFKSDLIRNLIFVLFFLALSTALLSVSACVVAGEQGPYHREPESRPPSKPGYSSSIDGPWSINVNNHPGRLDFHWSRDGWTGQIWLDESRRWEDLIDITFNPGPRHLEFTRPNGNQRYSGTLSGDQISGTLTSPYGTFPWKARRASPRPSKIDGLWSINVNNHPGRLEFRRSRNRWTGRISLDESRPWEDLIDIIFDPDPGHLKFTRPNGSQRYSGIVSGNEISGTLTSPYGTFPWEARRP